MYNSPIRNSKLMREAFRKGYRRGLNERREVLNEDWVCAQYLDDNKNIVNIYCADGTYDEVREWPSGVPYDHPALDRDVPRWPKYTAENYRMNERREPLQEWWHCQSYLDGNGNVVKILCPGRQGGKGIPGVDPIHIPTNEPPRPWYMPPPGEEPSEEHPGYLPTDDDVNVF